jgi:hypothetical protein
MEGAVIENGLASSFTHNSPRERRARIARPVGSERAANVELSWSGIYFTIWLISHTAKYIHRRDCVKQKLKENPDQKLGITDHRRCAHFGEIKGHDTYPPEFAIGMLSLDLPNGSVEKAQHCTTVEGWRRAIGCVVNGVWDGAGGGVSGMQ